jgi:hypothetical protein
VTDRPAFLTRHEQDVRDHVAQLLGNGALDEGNATAMDAYIDQLLEVEIGRMNAARQAKIAATEVELAGIKVDLQHAQAAECAAQDRVDDLARKLSMAQGALLGNPTDTA